MEVVFHFTWLRFVTHHWGIHFLRFHLIKLVKIGLFLMFLLLLLVMFIRLVLFRWWFSMKLLNFLIFFLLLLLVLLLLLIMKFLRLLFILMRVNNIFLNNFSLEEVMMLLFRRLRFVAHHGFVHLLWFHVIELIEVLFVLLSLLLLLLLIFLLLLDLLLRLWLFFNQLDHWLHLRFYIKLFGLVFDLILVNLWPLWVLLV